MLGSDRRTWTLAGGLVCLLAPLALAVGPASAKPRCSGKKATIVGTARGETIRGTRNPDVIVARGGDDRIIGLLSKDRICAGPGDDIVLGGTQKDTIKGQGGDDKLVGSEGKDRIYGGAGADILIGDSGADLLFGGAGPDRVLGGIQDDKLSGGGGGDAVIGGHGIDTMSAGGGDDLLRGDVNSDIADGGPGSDTASFATATPGGPNEPEGVEVNLRQGRATGDDFNDVLRGIENVIGSPFSDSIQGKGSGFVRGGYGDDSCDGFSSTNCPKVDPESATIALADVDTLDPGLLLLGRGGADDWTIRGSAGAITISGTGAAPGAGCQTAPGGIRCEIAPASLGYILAWGANGDDSVTIGGGMPDTALLKTDGGNGDDTLRGGAEADLIFAGETGADQLSGLGGDDALVARPGGGDTMLGGSGNDNLVTDSPCEGHVLNPGPGSADVSGFGHVRTGGVDARIGGTARLIGGTAACSPSQVSASTEVLEGTPFSDTLVALRKTDLLIGREGNDTCIGGIHNGC